MFYCIISVFVCTDRDEELLNKCIAQNHIIGDEHEVLVRPHGNSKRSESYIRHASTLKELTEVASEKTPKPAVHSISSHRGDVVGASSAGSLPRNERQVKNITRKIKSSGGSLDPLHSVMMMCKDTMKDFVRAVKGAPD